MARARVAARHRDGMALAHCTLARRRDATRRGGRTFRADVEVAHVEQREEQLVPGAHAEQEFLHIRIWHILILITRVRCTCTSLAALLIRNSY